MQNDCVLESSHLVNAIIAQKDCEVAIFEPKTTMGLIPWKQSKLISSSLGDRIPLISEKIRQNLQKYKEVLWLDSERGIQENQASYFGPEKPTTLKNLIFFDWEKQNSPMGEFGAQLFTDPIVSTVLKAPSLTGPPNKYSVDSKNTPTNNELEYWNSVKKFSRYHYCIDPKRNLPRQQTNCLGKEGRQNHRHSNM